MSQFDVKLDVGDGRIRSLSSQVNRLNHQLNKVYNRGLNNNNWISDKDLTNLQNNLRRTIQAINDRKNRVSSQLDQARANYNHNYSRLYSYQIEELTNATNQISQLFYSNHKYQAVNQFRVTSSRNFRSSQYDIYNSQFKQDYDDLRHLIGRYSNRIRTARSRWNHARENGVITGEQYDKYQNNAHHLNHHIGNVQDRFKEFNQNYQDELLQLEKTRNQLNQSIVNGHNSQANVQKRASLDEEINTLKKYQQGVTQMEQNLGKTNQGLNQLNRSLNNTQQIKVIPRQDTLRGYFAHHGRGILRGAAIAGIGRLSVDFARGNREILGSFDNVKSTAYATGRTDTHVENQLDKAGYPVGMDTITMSHYLGNFTGSTGNNRLSNNQIRNVAGNWAQLSRYSGATNSTTQNLEFIAGLTTLSSNPRQFSRLADQIQNSLTNSHMSAKANEQQRALAGMYQNAYQIGGPLSHQEQRNLAGFQAAMANTHDSAMQGSNGLQAYQGLTSAFRNTSPDAYMIFNAGNPSAFSSLNGHALGEEQMQRAAKNPYYYKPAIRNLLANAATQTKSKRGQRRIAAMNLMQLSQENGGHLTPDQAEKLVKMEQEGKFNKKELNKLTKGNGKGHKRQYGKSGTKSIQQLNAARNRSARLAAKNLNHLTRHLNWIIKTWWIAPIIGSVGGGIAQGFFGELLGPMLRSRSSSRILNAAKDIGGLILGTDGPHFHAHSTEYEQPYRNAERATRTGDEFSPRERTESRTYRGRHIQHENRVSHGTHRPFSDRLNSITSTRPLHHYAGRHRRHSQPFYRGRHRITSTRPAGRSRGVSRRLARYLRKYHRGTKLGLALGAGVGLYGLMSNHKAHAATRRHRHRRTKPHRTTLRDIYDMETHVWNKYRRLHKREWRLIRYLNTYWDVFLRKVKESAKNGSGNNDIGGDAGDKAKSPQEWADDIRKAAKAMGVNVSDEDVKKIISMIAGESGGNPAAKQQISDYNSAHGTPAQGLLQFVPSTFKTFAVPGHTNIYSGYDQLLALFNDSNWERDIHYGGGWGPTGTPRRHAIGEVRYHASGDITNVQTDQNSNSEPTILNHHFKEQIHNDSDLRSLFNISKVHQAQNYTKFVRNKPKFSVKIEVSQAHNFNKKQIINQTINDVYREWLNSKQNNKLMTYFANETSNQFIR